TQKHKSAFSLHGLSSIMNEHRNSVCSCCLSLSLSRHTNTHTHSAPSLSRSLSHTLPHTHLSHTHIQTHTYTKAHAHTHTLLFQTQAYSPLPHIRSRLSQVEDGRRLAYFTEIEIKRKVCQ